MQLNGASSGLRSLTSSAQRMKVHLYFFAAAQHPYCGVETSRGDCHLPSAHEFPVPGEKHLEDNRDKAMRATTQMQVDRMNPKAASAALTFERKKWV